MTPRKSAREDILRVFAKHVARDGYSDTSISDTARALGLSKGTVLHHFGTKRELLECVHVAYMERRLAEAHHILASLADPEAQLAAIVYALLKAHRDDRDATLAFLREIVRFADADEAMTAIRAQRATYTQLVETVVQRGMERGAFRSDDPTLVTLQIFGVCNYAWTWYRPSGPLSVEDVAGSIIRTVMVGLQGAQSPTVDALVDRAIATVRAAPPPRGP
jgi:AcrR family transcriptional regulator